MAMTLRTTADDDAAIERLAKRAGVSKNEAILRLVRNEDARHEHEDAVTASAEKMLDRYADLFERLKRT
ncbi:MAG: ribbon-helix-helix protein, CopG family [Microbacteriaceae bacterium]|nr:ribbon-helix-helix protein, CopG family [Microbacteriaceae bacterium]